MTQDKLEVCAMGYYRNEFRNTLILKYGAPAKHKGIPGYTILAMI